MCDRLTHRNIQSSCLHLLDTRLRGTCHQLGSETVLRKKRKKSLASFSDVIKSTSRSFLSSVCINFPHLSFLVCINSISRIKSLKNSLNSIIQGTQAYMEPCTNTNMGSFRNTSKLSIPRPGEPAPLRLMWGALFCLFCKL